MSENEAMGDFNWVRARADCSIAAVFEHLRLAVKRDVDAINAVEKERGRRFRFEFQDVSDRFGVFRQEIQGEGVRTAEFTRTTSRIRAQSQGVAALEAVPALNANGECKLLVDGAELEIWQFCQRALQPLFFGE